MTRRLTFQRFTAFARQLLERLLELAIVDRSLVVGAQAFGALIPLLIVAFTLLTLLWGAGFVLVAGAAIGSIITVPSWSRASPGSVTPRSSSSSTAPGS